MTESRPHLIALPRGRTRVLRLIAGAATYALRYEVAPEDDMCLECGCVERYACLGGCSWVDRAHTLCSRCHERSMLS